MRRLAPLTQLVLARPCTRAPCVTPAPAEGEDPGDMFYDPAKDKYITADDDGESDPDDIEDYTARYTDAFLVTANTEEEYSCVEVLVYNENDGNLFGAYPRACARGGLRCRVFRLPERVAHRLLTNACRVPALALRHTLCPPCSINSAPRHLAPRLPAVPLLAGL